MANRSDDYADYSRFSLDIERGDEDGEITHATSTRIRPGSRAPSSRASSGLSARYQLHSNFNSMPKSQDNINGGIQIIQDGFDDEDEWLLEDLSDGNEHDLESIESNSPSLNAHQQSNYHQQYQPFSERYSNHQLTEYRATTDIQQDRSRQQQLVVRNERGMVEVDTDEENDIVRKIKSEITQQVKEEIKDEIKQITYNEKEGDEDIDPRVKEALLQMRKYDRILEKRTRRERHVKRERIALQKKLREELDELNQDRPSGCKSSKDESVNTEKFLSLPPSIARMDKEVAEHSADDDEWSGNPLFATQPPMFDTSSKDSSRSNRGQRTDDASSTTGSQATNATGNSTDRRKRRRRRKQMRDADGKPVGDKDFIQRNIDLAADAGNTVAMTDDEKKRLADILENLDEIDESLLEQERTISNGAAKPGEGFALDNTSNHAMREINHKLESLMGADEYNNSILPAPSHPSYDSLQLFSRTHNQSSNGADITEIGERALQETREYRDQQKRLVDIERELENLSTAVQSEIESPMLTDQQLHALLDQCNRMMSRATVETDSLSQANSPRSALSSNREGAIAVVPQLDDSVLRTLLDQARSEGIVSRSERMRHEPDEDSSELITDSQRENLLLNPRTTSRATSRAAMNGTL